MTDVAIIGAGPSSSESHDIDIMGFSISIDMPS